MSFAETRYAHIVLDARGVPRIAGTTMKVVELVTAQTAYGCSAEERHFQFPPLSLGQIHLKVTCCEHRTASLLCSPAQGRAHPRQQFTQPKRLGEVVVSAGVKHCDLFGFLLTD